GGDLAGRFALIESGMPYARRLATDYCRRTGWDDYDEATPEADVKLITLVDRYFDPHIGRLTTLMSATVPHWLRDQHLRSRLIALPRNASSWSSKTRDMVLRLRKIFSVNAPVGDDGDEWQIADYRTPEERLADLQDEIGDIRRRIAYAKS